MGYELLEFFRSRLACCMPLLASVCYSHSGRESGLSYPSSSTSCLCRLGRLTRSVALVPSDFMQAKLIPGFFLRWEAAPHCPSFLNPSQPCCAGIPVIFWILSDNCVFFESC